MDHHRIDYHRQDAVLTHALSRFAEPFNHPDWILEIKWDGFRCLAFIENGCCRLVSRKGNEFKSFHALNIALPAECRAGRAVLDGEIVCLDEDGVSQFTELLFRRESRACPHSICCH